MNAGSDALEDVIPGDWVVDEVDDIDVKTKLISLKGFRLSETLMGYIREKHMLARK